MVKGDYKHPIHHNELVMNQSAYSAVIVSYNAKEVLGSTIDALLLSKPSPDEIVIVDNNSKEDIVGFVQKNYPSVTLIEAGSNLGFGKGNNLGIAQVKTKYVLLVNNDLCVEPDCAKKLMEHLEEHKKVAVASPFIYKGWDKSDKSTVYSFGSRIDEAGFTVNVETTPELAEASNCFSGACCMARTEILQQNPFDSRYFLYYEEPELVMRLAKLGYKTDRVAEAVAWHLENYSSPGKAAAALSFRQFYGIQNRWYALGKHWPVRLLPKAFVLNVLHLGYFLLYFARNKQFQYLSLVWRAPWNFGVGLVVRLIHFPKRSVNWWTMLYPASIGGMLQLKKKVIKPS